ncbi:MAG: hypothetical protein R2784_11175 [Saprospiraceae bacterium]
MNWDHSIEGSSSVSIDRNNNDICNGTGFTRYIKFAENGSEVPTVAESI